MRFGSCFKSQAQMFAVASQDRPYGQCGIQAACVAAADSDASAAIMDDATPPVGRATDDADVVGNCSGLMYVVGCFLCFFLKAIFKYPSFVSRNSCFPQFYQKLQIDSLI